MHDEELLETYVATFPKFDQMLADEFSLPAAIQLAVGSTDQEGQRLWKPTRVETPESHLQDVYAELPGTFPPLFERLLLSYRWAEVDLDTYRLMANPPGNDLNGFFHQMTNDPFLWEALVPGRLYAVRQGSRPRLRSGLFRHKST
jgi:hypothetical protein